MHRAHSKRVKGNIQEMPWLLSTSQAIFKANLGAQSPVSTGNLPDSCPLASPRGRWWPGIERGERSQFRSLDWALCEVCGRSWAPCSMPSTGR